MQRRTDVEKALRRRYPESVVLVLTRKPDGGANVMAVGWVSLASSAPVMFVLGIDDGAYTYERIRKTREFVVAYPNSAMAGAVLLAGSVHGRRRDKIAESGLALQPAASIAAPLLADAVANFECRLRTIYQPGDCPLIIGQVVAAHVNCRARSKRIFTVGPEHALGSVSVKRVAGAT